MAKGEYFNKTEKLLKLIELLCRSGRRWKARELANEMEIDVRQIYRYLEDIEAGGFLPLIKEDLYYSVDGSGLLANLNFNFNEMMVILLMANSVTDRVLRGEIEAVVEKIKRSMGSARSRLDHLAERMTVSLPPDAQTDVADTLSTLGQALTEHRRVRMRYRSREREAAVEREVDPWGLFLHDGSWYFTGYDHLRQMRLTFRLSRIVKLEVLHTRFEPREFTPQEVIYHHWDPPSGSAERSPQTIRLDTGPELARWLEENPVHPSQSIRANRKRFELTFKVGNPEKMVPWLMGLRDTRVLEPAWLAEQVAATARAVLERHQP